MINYQYPSTRELRDINPEKIVNMTRNRPTFDIFPITESPYWTLEWTQKDNWRGLQQLRGLNGEPGHVKMYGERAFSAKPGVFGEFMTIDEEMMTLRAQQVPSGEPVDISDLITEGQDYMNNRELDLIEYIHWKALLDGQFTFIGPTGATYGDQFSIQTGTFSDWSVLATATPLADLMGLKVLASGKSVSFGTGAQIFMNSVTLSYLLRNRNANDLGGQLAIASGGVKPAKTLTEINTLLAGFNLPTIVEYDEGYYAEASGTFTKWIPDDVVSIVGQRSNGDRLGEYRMVRNANNPDMAPGRYEKVIDHVDKRVPRVIELHRGHNGGLVIYYGSAFAVAAV
jgi:major capsid protein E